VTQEITQAFKLEIHYANCCGNAQNNTYPNLAVVTDADQFRNYVRTDHVFADFQNSRRSNQNFTGSSVLVADCDNDHSEQSADWIAPETLADWFPDAAFLTYTSRHHLKQKENHSPRPRFHVVFFTERITEAGTYRALLHKLQKHYPYFDTQAFDAGRFYFGNSETEVSFHPGTKSVLDYLNDLDAEQALKELGERIPEGQRNIVMHRKAVCLLKRFGDSEDTHNKFLTEAEKCSPLLGEQELETVWNSAGRFYHEEVEKSPGYRSPEEYNASGDVVWEEPIPFDDIRLPPFPVDALPEVIGNYVRALSESTQTPVDMAASAVFPILSVCLQGKYKIRGKQDWYEPLNCYSLVIMEPSERKSAVANAMVSPLNCYEAEYNRQYSASIESSRMQKRILERKQKALEEKAAKGKAERGELEEIALEIAEFKEKKPLRLYVDDITTEKLTSVLSENDGKAAILSTEGGIFDTLAGLYSKTVNIDVMLKGFSGDPIRVDRIGRSSENILNPSLSILLMIQPMVLSGMMQNKTFRGRGLTARFLYSMPATALGKRKFRSNPVPRDIYEQYRFLLMTLLEETEEITEPETITLSGAAEELLAAFAEELEPKLINEYADIADWAGKLVGTVLRISGLLCRASVTLGTLWGEPAPQLVVDGAIMDNAIRIGRYYIEHAKAAFGLMGADTTVNQARSVLNAVLENGLTEFNRRDIMRLCRKYRKAETVQTVLETLTEYGYIAPKDPEPRYGRGRPPAALYLVNPLLYREKLAS